MQKLQNLPNLPFKGIFFLVKFDHFKILFHAKLKAKKNFCAQKMGLQIQNICKYPVKNIPHYGQCIIYIYNKLF